MGSIIKINYILNISEERGFPTGLTLERHVQDPTSSQSFLGKDFDFCNDGARIYPIPPTDVFLVQDTNNKSLFWGKALVVSQTIEGGKTKGRYNIIKIYDPVFQRLITNEEALKGGSYFNETPQSLRL